MDQSQMITEIYNMVKEIHSLLVDRGMETAIGVAIKYFVDEFKLLTTGASYGGGITTAVMIWLANERFGIVGKAKKHKNGNKVQ